MPRLPAIAASAAVLTVVLAACGGDDEPANKAATTTEQSAATTARTESGPAKTKPGAETDAAATPDRRERTESKAAKARRIERDRKEAARELERLERQDRELDKAFEETPFDKVIAKLPIRKPPLYVQQYITDKGHELFTAVERKRFYCKMTPAQRKAAVAGFFRSADKTARAAGIDDLVVTVTPLSPTLEDLPALAIARRGSVSLTRLGRGKGRC